MTSTARAGRPGATVGSGSTPTPSPSPLTCEVPTAGGTVQVRPILPDDEDRLRQFHAQLSSRSVYLRYFFLHPELSEAEVHRLTHVDTVDRLALVATDRGRIVAVGRYDRLPGTGQAEVAFVVADEFQHQGIGTRLLAMLADAAVGNGISVLVAEALATNGGMIDMLLHSGFPLTSLRHDGTVQVRLLVGSGPPGATHDTVLGV